MQTKGPPASKNLRVLENQQSHHFVRHILCAFCRQHKFLPNVILTNTIAVTLEPRIRRNHNVIERTMRNGRSDHKVTRHCYQKITPPRSSWELSVKFIYLAHFLIALDFFTTSHSEQLWLTAGLKWPSNYPALGYKWFVFSDGRTRHMSSLFYFRVRECRSEKPNQRR